MSSKSKSKIDWSKVLEVIINILTIGLGHVKKHRNGTGSENENPQS